MVPIVSELVTMQVCHICAVSLMTGLVLILDQSKFSNSIANFDLSRTSHAYLTCPVTSCKAIFHVVLLAFRPGCVMCCMMLSCSDVQICLPHCLLPVATLCTLTPGLPYSSVLCSSPSKPGSVTPSEKPYASMGKLIPEDSAGTLKACTQSTASDVHTPL